MNFLFRYLNVIGISVIVLAAGILSLYIYKSHDLAKHLDSQIEKDFGTLLAKDAKDIAKASSKS